MRFAGFNLFILSFISFGFQMCHMNFVPFIFAYERQIPEHIIRTVKKRLASCYADFWYMTDKIDIEHLGIQIWEPTEIKQLQIKSNQQIVNINILILHWKTSGVHFYLVGIL